MGTASAKEEQGVFIPINENQPCPCGKGDGIGRGGWAPGGGSGNPVLNARRAGPAGAVGLLSTFLLSTRAPRLSQSPASTRAGSPLARKSSFTHTRQWKLTRPRTLSFLVSDGEPAPSQAALPCSPGNAPLSQPGRGRTPMRLNTGPRTFLPSPLGAWPVLPCAQRPQGAEVCPTGWGGLLSTILRAPTISFSTGNAPRKNDVPPSSSGGLAGKWRITAGSHEPAGLFRQV